MSTRKHALLEAPYGRGPTCSKSAKVSFGIFSLTQNDNSVFRLIGSRIDLSTQNVTLKTSEKLDYLDENTGILEERFIVRVPVPFKFIPKICDPELSLPFGFDVNDLTVTVNHCQ